jgi:hypothetical protein
MGREARGHTHVEIFREVGLEVGLTNVSGGELVVARSSKGEHQAERGKLSDSREDIGEVNPIALSVAICDETTLKLIDGAVPIPFHCED